MTFTILPVDASDAGSLIEIGMQAFANDTLTQKTMNTQIATKEQLAEIKEWRSKILRARLPDPAQLYIKAVDDTTGSVAGYTAFKRPRPASDDSTKKPDIPEPSFINHEAMKTFDDWSAATMKRLLEGREDVWCEL